jgi:Flp pilus assembly protein TadG
MFVRGHDGRKQSGSGVPRRDRGNSLVEFALVAPLAILLLVGTIEFGIQFNNYQSVRSGVRDAARMAVVSRIPTTCSPTNVPTDDLVCYVRQRIGLGTDTAVKVVVTAADAADANDKGSIKVCAERPASSLTGLFSVFLNGRYLRSQVEMRVERGTGPGYAAYQDAAPSGSWTC